MSEAEVLFSETVQDYLTDRGQYLDQSQRECIGSLIARLRADPWAGTRIAEAIGPDYEIETGGPFGLRVLLQYTIENRRNTCTVRVYAAYIAQVM